MLQEEIRLKEWEAKFDQQIKLEQEQEILKFERLSGPDPQARSNTREPSLSGTSSASHS